MIHRLTVATIFRNLNYAKRKETPANLWTLGVLQPI
jgi:hypothetical protein